MLIGKKRRRTNALSKRGSLSNATKRGMLAYMFESAHTSTQKKHMHINARMPGTHTQTHGTTACALQMYLFESASLESGAKVRRTVTAATFNRGCGCRWCRWQQQHRVRVITSTLAIGGSRRRCRSGRHTQRLIDLSCFRP